MLYILDVNLGFENPHSDGGLQASNMKDGNVYSHTICTDLEVKDGLGFQAVHCSIYGCGGESIARTLRSGCNTMSSK